MKKRNLIAVLMSVVLAATSTAGMPTCTAADQPQGITEQEAVAYLCAELGIDDWDAYVADFAAKISEEKQRGMNDTDPYNPAYYIDIYTGGNSNGVIDAFDATYLQKFLKGMINYPYTFSDLDPTQNYIIDQADVAALTQCYIYHILLEEHPEFVPGTHGTTNNVYLSENRDYYKFNAQTGALIDDYTLDSPNTSATSLSFSNNTEPNISEHSSTPTRMVVGTDGRIPDNTRTGAVKIMKQSNSPSWGSGCIIDAHTIITAAHILYRLPFNSNGNGTPQIISQIRLLDESGNRIIKTPDDPSDGDDFTPVEYHIPCDYTTKTQPARDDEFSCDGYDYAIVTVEEDLSAYTEFTLGFALNGLISSNSTVGVTGYPKKVNNQTVNSDLIDKRYYGSGILRSVPNLVESKMLGHKCDTSGNNSGSPLHYTYANGAETQIGVHVRQRSDETVQLLNNDDEFNYATRINVDILHFCLNNSYALH